MTRWMEGSSELTGSRFVLVIAHVVNTPAKFKKSEVKQILEKLDRCYNVDNDPRSDNFKEQRLKQFQSSTDYEMRNFVSMPTDVRWSQQQVRFFLLALM